MNMPELYTTINKLPRRDAQELLDEYMHLVHWKRDGGDRVLEVGCGPGDITVQILLPKLPATVDEVLATDISPDMIQYARQHYQHAKVTYAVLDIATRTLPYMYQNQFDHVFSVICLQWMTDIRRAVKNIHSMLSVGGDMLLIYMSEVPIFEVMRKLGYRPFWRKHTPAVLDTVPRQQPVSILVAEMRAILHDLGFEDVTCQSIPRVFTYDSFDLYLNVQLAVNPFLRDMPAALRDRYMSEYVAEIREQMRVKNYTSCDDDEGVCFTYSVMVVNARKPK